MKRFLKSVLAMLTMSALWCIAMIALGALVGANWRLFRAGFDAAMGVL